MLEPLFCCQPLGKTRGRMAKGAKPELRCLHTVPLCPEQLGTSLHQLLAWSRKQKRLVSRAVGLFLGEPGLPARMPGKEEN